MQTFEVLLYSTREFIIKGFVLDDERLKQGAKFGKDYFEELNSCLSCREGIWKILHYSGQ